MTFVRNQAKAIIACDFFVFVTATFQLIYAFLIMEVGTRRLLHFNVTRRRFENALLAMKDTGL